MNILVLTTKVLCITNTYAKANLLTKSNMKFSVVFMMKFVARNRVCGNHASVHYIMITSWPIVRILSRISMYEITQGLYSSHMAPYDFWLLINLKMWLKGSPFDNRENIMNNIPWQSFQNKTSINISSNDRTVRLNLWSHKGHTSMYSKIGTEIIVEISWTYILWEHYSI